MRPTSMDQCEQVDGFVDKSEKLYNGLEDRLNKLDQKVELGPPGLWKLTAQVCQMRQGLLARGAAPCGGSSRGL